MRNADELLDELMVLPADPAPPAHSEVAPLAAQSVAKAVQRLNYSHDGMIDLILANPGISQNEIALRIGYSASWVSTVMACDAFQARLAERRKEVIDPNLLATAEERFKGIALRAAEVISEKLKAEPADIPDQLALRAFELASRASGYGANPNGQLPQLHVHAHLEDLGNNLTQLLQRRKKIVEVDSYAEITKEASE